MSLPALQNDSNVPSSKKMGNGNPYWLNHVLVHTNGVSDGTGDGQWSYDTGASHRIEYNATHDKWFDLTDGQPSKISDTYNVNTTAVAGSSTGANPAEVFLWNSNGGAFLGKFANPFYTAPPSGGGTSTESSTSSAVASLGLQSGVLKMFIPASSTGGSYSVFEGSTLKQVTTHVATVADMVTITSWSMGNSSIWRVYFNGNIINTWPAAIPSTSTTKKVHCNFW